MKQVNDYYNLCAYELQALTDCNVFRVFFFMFSIFLSIFFH